MNSAMSVDLFVEDRAHEALLGAFVRRIAREEELDVLIRVRSARGGHGRAVQEFVEYQRLLKKGAIRDCTPELIVVAIDGNCSKFAKKRQEITRATEEWFRDRLVAACPDPHIER